jgi:hypothetical protein
VIYDALHLFVNPVDGYRLSDRIWRADAKTRNRINELLAHEIRQGTAAVDIAKLLERYLEPERIGIRTRKPYGQWGSFDARRLARTEVTAAHGRATIAAAAANPYVEGVQWALSIGREDWDCNCEGNATADAYGMGEGVYPTDAVPLYPDHPHCVCTLRPVVTRNPADVTAEIRGWLDGESEPPPQVAWLFDVTKLLGSILSIWKMKGMQ